MKDDIIEKIYDNVSRIETNTRRVDSDISSIKERVSTISHKDMGPGFSSIWLFLILILLFFSLHQIMVNQVSIHEQNEKIYQELVSMNEILRGEK